MTQLNDTDYPRYYVATARTPHLKNPIAKLRNGRTYVVDEPDGRPYFLTRNSGWTVAEFSVIFFTEEELVAANYIPTLKEIYDENRRRPDPLSSALHEDTDDPTSFDQ